MRQYEVGVIPMRWGRKAERRGRLSGDRPAASVAIAALLAAACGWSQPADALTIELLDVAPDRLERQRAQALGMLPLPGTPQLHRRDERLAELGVKPGNEVFIRIFKQESELELWMRRGESFVLFATYPICYWSGTLGPKVTEGDRQTPEGFYRITRQRLHRSARWPQSINLGFPNALERHLNRTGSYLLVHGGCSSVGCYSMTDAVISEIFELVEQALKGGQDAIDIHAFPFRMTDAAIAEATTRFSWSQFWSNLKEGYDAFEATRVPPLIGHCNPKGTYAVQRLETASSADAVLQDRVSRIPHNVRLGSELPAFCPETPSLVQEASAATASSRLGGPVQSDVERLPESPRPSVARQRDAEDEAADPPRRRAPRARSPREAAAVEPSAADVAFSRRDR